MINTYDYDKIVGLIVTCLEDAANMKGHVETSDINRILNYSKEIDLENSRDLLQQIVSFRNKVVHNPYDFENIHSIIEDIKVSDLYKVIQFFKAECGMSYNEALLGDLMYLFMFVKENVNFKRTGKFYVVSVEEQKQLKEEGIKVHDFVVEKVNEGMSKK